MNEWWVPVSIFVGTMTAVVGAMIAVVQVIDWQERRTERVRKMREGVALLLQDARKTFWY